MGLLLCHGQCCHLTSHSIGARRDEHLAGRQAGCESARVDAGYTAKTVCPRELRLADQIAAGILSRGRELLSLANRNGGG